MIENSVVSCPPCWVAVEVNADAWMLGELVRNLLANAIDFSPAGGTITLDPPGIARDDFSQAGAVDQNAARRNLYRGLGQHGPDQSKDNRDGKGGEQDPARPPDQLHRCVEPLGARHAVERRLPENALAHRQALPSPRTQPDSKERETA